MSRSNMEAEPVGDPAHKCVAIYRMRYLCNGYTMADAFRTVPGWGTKVFTVRAEDIGDHNDADVVQAAHDTVPNGYWLQLVEAIGGDPHVRQVWIKSITGKTLTC